VVRNSFFDADLRLRNYSLAVTLNVFPQFFDTVGWVTFEGGM